MDESDPIARVVHPECAPKPGTFTGTAPGTFVGTHVKLGFPCEVGEGGTTIEHMWVLVERVNSEGKLVGEVRNDPVLRGSPACGEIVRFAVDEIEEIEAP